ncbi:MAG: hypothetical protein RR869_03510 [Lachnospiraceae bacterium]
MIKVEIYKLFYNKLTLGVLLVLSLGIQISERFKPDFWLLFACVLVGQTLGEGFMDGTLKNEVMVIQERKRIILGKMFSAILILFFIYVINICLFYIKAEKNIVIYRQDMELIVYQFFLIAAQVVFLMGLNIFLKSYSGLAIATMILFVFYHVCEMVQGKSMLSTVSNYTLLKLFGKVDLLGGCVFGVLAITLFALGIRFFKRSEL